MSISTITDREFEVAWDSAPDSRFSYALNMAVMVLYSVLISGFWCYWSISGLMGGFDWVLIAMGVFFGTVTTWVGFTVLYWRSVGRLSAVVCNEERILWRHNKANWTARWKDVDFDTLGLYDVDLSERKYEHYLLIGDQRLYLYRPHLRMRNMEGFLQHLLVNLKAHGRLPKKSGKGKKKGGKGR